MVLRRYVEHAGLSAVPTKEITGLFRRPIRLANLLLRLRYESPVPCHTEMNKYLVEAYAFIDDVEGRLFWIVLRFNAIEQQASP